MRTGGQGNPTPILTPTPILHTNIHKKYLKRSIFHFTNRLVLWWGFQKIRQINGMWCVNKKLQIPILKSNHAPVQWVMQSGIPIDILLYLFASHHSGLFYNFSISKTFCFSNSLMSFLPLQHFYFLSPGFGFISFFSSHEISFATNWIKMWNSHNFHFSLHLLFPFSFLCATYIKHFSHFYIFLAMFSIW